MERQDVIVKVGGAASASLAGGSVSILMTAYLLLDWFEIAVRHEQEARRIRAGDATRERQEAMIAVSATAHALDGLAWVLEQQLRADELEPLLRRERRKAGRAGEINAALVLAVGVEPTRWRARLKELIKTLRDPAVHPKAKAQPPVLHPDRSRQASVAAESASYSLERATDALNLLCEIISEVVTSAAPAAQAVSPSIRPRVEQLLAERRRLAEGSPRAG